MTLLEFGLLLLAGLAGGFIGSVAGLASLATYPALLAIGLSPVDANVTNTVALVLSTVGAVAGSRPELTGQAARLRVLAPIAVLGGAVGAALLLTTPADGFEKVVPILLGLASLTILIPRRPAAAGPGEPEAPPRRRVVQSGGIFAIAVYGGYFGAAAGVLMLALLLQTTRAGLPRANAAKNVLVGMSNMVAATAFALLAPVHWGAVLPLGIGCLLGSRVGPVLVRRLPATPVRVVIGVAALGLAVHLGLQAW